MTLLATNIFISAEFATGYVEKTWGDRMLILVTISSCLITVGQTLSKTAFAVTLLRITEAWQRWVIWFIIGTLNLYLVIVIFINWTNYCDETPYWWRMSGSCVPYNTIFGIKIGQNSESTPLPLGNMPFHFSTPQVILHPSEDVLNWIADTEAPPM